MCYTKTNQRGESMYSLLNAVDSAIKSFLGQLAESLGFIGVLAIVLGVELFFIILFAIKSAFSYEARLSRTLDKANAWLFNNKTLNENNVRAFTNIIKSGPKRMTYYWQQFILYREGGPTAYMTEENLIEKPLKSSSWKNNVKNHKPVVKKLTAGLFVYTVFYSKISISWRLYARTRHIE